MDYFEVGDAYGRIQRGTFDFTHDLKLRTHFGHELATRVLNLAFRIFHATVDDAVRGAIIGVQASLIWALLCSSTSHSTTLLAVAPRMPAAFAALGAVQGLVQSTGDVLQKQHQIKMMATGCVAPQTFIHTVYHHQRRHLLARISHIACSFKKRPWKSSKALCRSVHHFFIPPSSSPNKNTVK